ncbi:MAG: endolytic transglycosylase MltG [Solirubrobacterales bacterium]
MTDEHDRSDPYSGDDAAEQERERRRAEREARRRERLGDRVRGELSTEEDPPPAAGPPPAPAPTDATAVHELLPPPPGEEPPAPAAVVPPARGGPPRATVVRRRLIALVGVLALAFAAFVVVVVAKRVGGTEAPVGPPPKARKTFSVTIPEGYSREQMAAVAKEAGLEGDYVKATESFKGFQPERYDAQDPPNLEGFLFPATYELFKNADAEDLVAKQLQAFEQNIEAVDFSYAESKNLTRYDVLKIASMIEREVQVPEERADVSSVIYNRLANDMPLGIDATIRFEDGNYDEQLFQSRLAEDTPYNTRTNTGLPPGPIGSPGLASIEAAAKPAQNDLLFFVVKPGTCGEHVFTETEDEFFRAEAEYQAALQAEGGSPTEC